MSDTKQPCPYCRGATRGYAHVQDDTGIECPYCSPFKQPTGEGTLTAAREAQIRGALKKWPHYHSLGVEILTELDRVRAALQSHAEVAAAVAAFWNAVDALYEKEFLSDSPVCKFLDTVEARLEPNIAALKAHDAALLKGFEELVEKWRVEHTKRLEGAIALGNNHHLKSTALAKKQCADELAAVIEEKKR